MTEKFTGFNVYMKNFYLSQFIFSLAGSLYKINYLV